MNKTELHQQYFHRGRRSYYFDIKKTQENRLYLVCSENIRHANDWKRHKIMIFEEDAEEFVANVKKCMIHFRLLAQENADSKSKMPQTKAAKTAQAGLDS